jgi:predicted RNase H-like nuclease (RuvC/YqgF family)
MRYIQNIHTAPITAVVKNAKGVVILTKRFSPAKVDKFTGRIEETGFTSLTDDEYALLDEGSKTFTVYRDKHGLLVEHDELPPEAKTPHEALVDAKKDARKAGAQIASLNDEIVRLKAELLDAENRYKDLFDASGGEKGSGKTAEELEAVKRSLTETVAAKDEVISRLTEECEKLKAAAESAFIERNAAITALKDAKEKLNKKGKEFD